jgi:hypothetical protein
MRRSIPAGKREGCELGRVDEGMEVLIANRSDRLPIPVGPVLTAQNRGGADWPDFGDGSHQRRGAWARGARGRLGLPWGALSAGWDGRRRRLHGSRRPVVLGGGGRARELQ